ncbi:MAG: AIR synthase family protein [Lachnospiraceae bacterium]|nr:AIR synthase family protein [Lachnospiraceae bacterium]
MEIGKIPENILKRSVMRQLKTKRAEVVVGSSVGEDCAAIRLEADEEFVLSTDPITGTAKDIGKLAVLVTTNDLASAGATPVGIMLTVLLPPDSEEATLREIMQQVNAACEVADIQVIGGHTEVTDVVNQPVISVTGVGKVKRGGMISTGGAKPGMDLVATKWIGIEGTAIIAKEKEAELRAKFPDVIVDAAKAMDQYLSVQKDGQIAAACGAAAMHDVTEGGIFGALWEMAEASHVGLQVELSRIPIRQETVEICEFYDLNPYQLISSGCMLIATADGNGLVHALEEAGIGAAIIGRTTEGRDRVVSYDGETRFLEPPKSDEFHKVL